jgi:hypothetical protein
MENRPMPTSDYHGNRIAVADVLAAYVNTGIKPARTGEDWFDADGCGCAATALIAARVPGFCNPHWPFPMAAASLEVSRPYLRGFVAGFDGVSIGVAINGVADADRDETRVGYRDGQAAAAAVFTKGSSVA